MKHKFIRPLALCVAALLLCGGLTSTAQTVTVPLAGSYVTAQEDVGFLWPAPTSRYITSGFGNRKISLYGYERFHTGVDIHGAIGTEVLAIADGTVVVSTYDDGWGDYMIINHGDNVLSLYAHLNCRYIKRGESVTRGQAIGELGNSGFSSGPHLHFEMRENGKSVNPFRFRFYDE